MTFGHLAGIPLRVHLNWFFIAGLVTWSLASGYFPQEYPDWGVLTYWSIGLVTSFSFFVSVLLHEVAHALVALQEGVSVKSITLFILGGVAHIANEPPTAGSEFRIVVAGPVLSLFLSGLFYSLYLAAGSSQTLSAASLYLSQINLVLALFNLIPGFPLDGGRILRSIIWKLKGDFLHATRLGTYAGIAVALLFVLAGIAIIVKGNFFGGAWMGFIGWYLGNAAQESYRQSVVMHAAIGARLWKTLPKNQGIYLPDEARLQRVLQAILGLSRHPVRRSDAGISQNSALEIIPEYISDYTKLHHK
jgi:Zn-dependent protease